MTAVVAALGLGANLGDREAALDAGLAGVCDGGDTRLLRRSSLYETAPWGDLDQGPFLNLCALVETRLSARAADPLSCGRGGAGPRPRQDAALGAAADRHRHPVLR